MGRHLILDTNFPIAFERDEVDRAALADDTLTIAAISAAEFRQGIELADTQQRATGRQMVWDAIANVVTILSTDTKTRFEDLLGVSLASR